MTMTTQIHDTHKNHRHANPQTHPCSEHLHYKIHMRHTRTIVCRRWQSSQSLRCRLDVAVDNVFTDFSVSQDDIAAAILSYLRIVGHKDNRASSTVELLESTRISKDVRVSKLPVASSAKITAGSLTKARAMATRCICPPDIWLLL